MVGAEIAAVCWSIWKARNEVVWQKNYTRVYVIVARSKQYLEQWKFAQNKASIICFPNLVERDGNSVWVKPQRSIIKVLVDAATVSEFNSYGAGLVARDSSGGLVLAKMMYKTVIVEEAMTEAMTIKEALSWIKSMQWQGVVVESDSLVAVKSFRSKVQWTSVV
ncbi:uncharacterized protein LOC141710786 [Apium graveolens]|uniref:uncharacterized protein LOC141710786 n=1 Tax=Apium graveolens TaxID=4045 RepID=UPI003D7A292B